MKSKNRTDLEKIHEANKELQKIEKKKEEFEENLLELKRQIRNSERKLSNLKRSDKWRERNHILIEYGALLEISDLLKETKCVGSIIYSFNCKTIIFLILLLLILEKFWFFFCFFFLPYLTIT